MNNEQIAQLIKSNVYNWNYFGLRVIPHDYEVEVGEELEESYSWVDGVMTDEFLAGVSTIGVKTTCGDEVEEIAINVADALKLAQIYSGKQIALVCADRSEYGEDEGELILTGHNEVIATWNK